MEEEDDALVLDCYDVISRLKSGSHAANDPRQLEGTTQQLAPQKLSHHAEFDVWTRDKCDNVNIRSPTSAFKE